MAPADFSNPIESEADLIDRMTTPSPAVTAAVAQMRGKVMILGVSGKMGPTLGELLVRAGASEVIGVSRFSNPAAQTYLEERGVRTIPCDLLDDGDLSRLPDAPHIVLMAGFKFGSSGDPSGTWATNTLLPAKALRRFPESRIIYLSNGTPLLIVRLFYASELRYGIVLDLAQKIWRQIPIELGMGHVNQIWQGDANAYLARMFPLCDNPARVINMTGGEVLSVRALAQDLGRIMNVEPVFRGRESETALLGDATALFQRLGRPQVSPETLVSWVAHWVMSGGRTLGKPTGYQSRSGEF